MLIGAFSQLQQLAGCALNVCPSPLADALLPSTPAEGASSMQHVLLGNQPRRDLQLFRKPAEMVLAPA